MDSKLKTKNSKLISFADLIGKPYKNNARGPEAFDCWGLVLVAATRAGIYLPELEVPQTDDLRFDMIELQKKNSFIKLEKAVPFSIVLFRIIDDNNIIKWHVGLVLENCIDFIHTTDKMGVNISSLKNPLWQLFIEGFYNMSDVSDSSGKSEL